MAKLRIAYLTGEYPRATDTFVQREVSALRAMGIEVHTFSVRRTAAEHMTGPEQVAEQKNTHYLIPANPIQLLRSFFSLFLHSPVRFFRAIRLAWDTRQPGLRGTLYQLFYFSEACLLAAELRGRGVQHLHNHFANSSCSVSLLASTLGGITFSFTLHGPAIFFEPKLWRIDEKIRRALFVSCISYFSRSQGMIFAPTDCWPHMHVIHCGVDPELSEPVHHKGRGRNLLFVGRLSAVKGLAILLESLSHLKVTYPDLMLTVVGDGPEREQLEKHARELSIENNVRFEGFQSQAAIRQYLRETDVFVMSSFAEGVPVVLMEAMAFGVPVVASQIAGVSELVDHGKSGLLVPPAHPRALTAAIEHLLVDSNLRAKMGQRGRQKVIDDFNIHTEARRLYQVLTSTLEGRDIPTRPEVD